jgi:RHS repeat-associated protein
VWVPSGAKLTISVSGSIVAQSWISSYYAQQVLYVKVFEANGLSEVKGWTLYNDKGPLSSPFTLSWGPTKLSEWVNTGAARTMLVRTQSGAGLRSSAQWDTTVQTTAGNGGANPGCVDERTKRGGGLGSVGDVEDPVNSFTGSYTESRRDLEATAGLFGLDWVREYDSGGTAGSAAWGFSFDDRVEVLGSGDVELTLPSSRVVVFGSDGVGGFERPVEYDGRLEVDGTGWKLSFSDGSSKFFDSSGVMTSWESWDGQVVAATYSSGQLSALTSTEGPWLSLAYTAGKLTSVTASDGRVVTYSYDMNGFLAGVVLPGSLGWSYTNDTAGRVSLVEDPTGVDVVSLVYDGAGRVSSQTTASGAHSTFSYDLPRSKVDVTDVAASRTSTYYYDGLGRLTSVKDPNGEVVERAYDSFDELTATTSRLGAASTVARNARGLITEIDAPDAEPVAVSYDASNRVESVSDASGTTTYSYDGAERVPSSITDAGSNVMTIDVLDGRIASVTDADGVTVEYRHNALGQLVEIEDEHANVTVFSYDAVGRLVAQQMPSGARTEIDYDAAGRPEVVTAADGGVATTTYDSAGRVLSVTDAMSAQTSYVYDPASGLLSSMTDPMGRVTAYSYNVYGDLERTTFEDTSFREADHGVLGRLEATRDELGRETTYSYDADGHIASVLDPAGAETATVYDSAGRVVSVSDPMGRETTYSYEPDTGLLTSVSSLAGATTYSYDALGRQRTVTDLRGGVSETAYTPGGRVDWVEDPLDRRTEYTYDDAGRLASITEPGSLTTTYGYDEDSRVALVRSPEGNETLTTYDGLGRVLTVTDPAGVVSANTWTKTGQIETTTSTGEGTVEFSYNPDGTLGWVDDALGNRTNFTYNDRGRLESRTDAELNTWSTVYDPAGQLVSETDPLNRTTSYTYDGAGRMQTRSDPSGRSTTWSWHPDGLVDTRIDDDGTDTNTVDYSYDTIGRRSAAAVTETSFAPLADVTTLYSYNAAGDLTSESLISVMGASVRTLSYDYDIAGQRTRLHRADGTTVLYEYDDAGRVETLTAGEAAADSFAGVSSGPWDESKWDTTSTDSATARIDNGTGAMDVAASPGSALEAKSLTPPSADGDTAVTYAFVSGATTTEFRLDARTINSGDRYSLGLAANSSTAAITKTVSGTTTTLATFAVPVGTDAHRARLKVEGSTISAKVWDPDTTEPETWSVTTTDTSITGTGTPGLYTAAGTGAANTVTVDDWTHNNASAGPPELVDYGWDKDSKLTSEILADGGTRDWTWTDARLAGMDQNIAGAPSAMSLGYDSAGRINAETVDGVTTAYGYDNAGQLLSAEPDSEPASAWTYDTLGNRATQTIGSDTTTYTYDNAGELTTATRADGPATTYTYDQAGRRLSETTGSDTTAFAYNPAGQLALTVLPSTEMILRTSDADGASVGFYTDNSATIRYQFYDWDTTSGIAELTAIAAIGYNATGAFAETTDLTRAAGTPWASAQSTSTLDALASDIHHSTIDSTATNLAAAATYTPWGETDTTTPEPRLGYRGELTIAGHTHLRARDYDPTTGTFTTPDPLNGIPGTTTANNNYHYTNNNPLNLTDPTVGVSPSSGQWL